MFRTLAAFAFLALAATSYAQPGKAGWHSDYESARAEARRTGKPIFLVFRCEP